MSDDLQKVQNLTPADEMSIDEPKPPTSPSKASVGVQTPSVRLRSKSNEEVILEELRSTGQNYLNVWRTGVTVLPGILLVIAFLRREVLEKMAESDSTITAIPLDRYLLGTLFLFMVAYIFYSLCMDIAARWRWYADKLRTECDNAIGLPGVTEGQRRMSFFRRVFFVFPAFDLFVRATLEVERIGFLAEYVFIAIICSSIWWLTIRRRATP